MNKSLEYVRNQIIKLKDDLQHYTMVEKDSVLASQIRYDLEQFETIEKALKRLEDIDSILNTGGGLWAENGIVSKKLKAFEIILKKFVSPQDFILCNYTLNDKKWLSYEEYKKAYMKYYEDDKYLLLEEEYDLLKEVVL